MLWTTSQKPAWVEGGPVNTEGFVGGTSSYMLLSVPSYLYMTELFMDEVPWRYLLIRMKDPDDHATID